MIASRSGVNYEWNEHAMDTTGITGTTGIRVTSTAIILFMEHIIQAATIVEEILVGGIIISSGIPHQQYRLDGCGDNS